MRVFERAVRLERTHYSEGWGLGLWIVKRIVDVMQGDVQLSGDLGQGATFTVRLPRAAAPAPHGASGRP